jgi:hypothetical protein
MTNPTSSVSENVSPWPTIFRIGLFGGMIFIVVAMISNLTGFSVPTSIGGAIGSLVVSIALAVAVGVWAVREHREKDLGGYISFGQALLVGFMALLIASLLNGAFNLLYVTVIDPSYTEAAIQKTAEWMQSMGMSEGDIEAQLSAMEDRLTPGGMLRQTVIGSVIISLVIGLIVGAVMKKNPPVFNDVLDD